MKIPLTKYGMPQVAAYPALILTVMAIILYARSQDIVSQTPFIITESIMTIVMIWLLAFFRDPDRTPSQDTNILLSPADGVVSDIEIVDEDSFINGKALRIGIFLNIFNVHINRTPCKVKIEDVTYKEGLFKNALDPDSARVNESNDIAMTRLDPPTDKLIVRQISGAIAKRIVCNAKAGQDFACGQKFGMIKFGSRTELYLPASENAKCQVSVGDKVKAGLTILVSYSDRV